jgi:biopolymer transport protein ExbD
MRLPESRSNLDPTENMMTSMIDVVFLLLIFFLVAAAGRRSEAKLPVELSAGGSGGVALAPPATTEEVWIRATTGANGATTWTINETEYATTREVRDVLTQLAELQPDMPVILDIGPEVPAGDLVEVYDACRAAGLEAINFNLKKVTDE